MSEACRVVYCSGRLCSVQQCAKSTTQLPSTTQQHTEMKRLQLEQVADSTGRDHHGMLCVKCWAACLSHRRQPALACALPTWIMAPQQRRAALGQPFGWWFQPSKSASREVMHFSILAFCLRVYCTAVQLHPPGAPELAQDATEKHGLATTCIKTTYPFVWRQDQRGRGCT